MDAVVARNDPEKITEIRKILEKEVAQDQEVS